MSQRFTIAALGEVLWDVFPDGPRFGGAPANLACHAAALGADVFMVSQVGDDPLGRQAVEELRQHGVHTDHVARSPNRPTGTVQVDLDSSGKPAFTIRQNVAWDQLAWSDELNHLAARADAVCFGTLGQRNERSRDTIQRFVAATPPATYRILDVNLRPPFYDQPVIEQSLAAANVVKLSDDELPILASMLGIDPDEGPGLAELRDRYHLRLAALTRGDRGARLVDPDRTSDVQGVPTDVKDTVGAGDAYSAVLTLGLLNKEPLEEINRRACQLAAFVCSQAGATPQLPDSWRNV
jgi:fructokinase